MIYLKTYIDDLKHIFRCFVLTYLLLGIALTHFFVADASVPTVVTNTPTPTTTTTVSNNKPAISNTTTSNTQNTSSAATSSSAGVSSFLDTFSSYIQKILGGGDSNTVASTAVSPIANSNAGNASINTGGTPTLVVPPQDKISTQQVSAPAILPNNVNKPDQQVTIQSGTQLSVMQQPGTQPVNAEQSGSNETSIRTSSAATVIPEKSTGIVCPNGQTAFISNNQQFCLPFMLCGQGGIACPDGSQCIRKDNGMPCQTPDCVNNGAASCVNTQPAVNGTAVTNNKPVTNQLKLSGNYLIATVAGSGVQGAHGDGGAATMAALNQPTGVMVNSDGIMTIVDPGNGNIRRIDKNGTIATLLNKNTAQPPVTLLSALSIGIDTAGNIYTIDNQSHNLIQINAETLKASVIATAVTTRNVVGHLAVDKLGAIYFSDTDNHQLKKVAKVDGVYRVTVIAGTGAVGFSDNINTNKPATFNSPQSVCVTSEGDLLVADVGNHVIRQLRYNPTQGSYTVTTIAGTPMINGYEGDGGAATLARLSKPSGVATDSQGNIYIADTHNQVVRIILATTGVIQTIAGTRVSAAGYSGDNGPATNAQLSNPVAVTADDNGNVYVVDQDNFSIRKLSPIIAN